jgi:hypothetical protein
MDIKEQLKNMSAEDRRSLRKEIIEKGKYGKDHVASKPIVCVETGKVYACQREVSEALGLDKNGVSHLTRACRFGYTDHGYHWRYYEPNELVRLLLEKGYTKYPMSYDGDIWYCYVQMAMAWLREEHNIYVCPKLRCFRGSKKNDKPYFEWEDSVLRLPSSNQLHPHALEICKHYQTYEQAVEAALLYVLQNLI